MKHLDMKTILALAMRGETASHLDVCSFCSEQYQLAVDFLAFSPDDVHREEKTYEEAAVTIPPSWRLAAQHAQPASPLFRLRRTWYFNTDGSILRVIEDTQKQVLTGFFISERRPEGMPRIRFDGISEDFRPDTNGVFEIGAASINIEPMQVTIVEN